MKYVLCVYDCVRACVCVANGCTYMFIALAVKGLNGPGPASSKGCKVKLK